MMSLSTDSLMSSLKTGTTIQTGHYCQVDWINWKTNAAGSAPIVSARHQFPICSNSNQHSIFPWIWIWIKLLCSYNSKNYLQIPSRGCRQMLRNTGDSLCNICYWVLATRAGYCKSLRIVESLNVLQEKAQLENILTASCSTMKEMPSILMDSALKLM